MSGLFGRSQPADPYAPESWARGLREENLRRNARSGLLFKSLGTEAALLDDPAFRNRVLTDPTLQELTGVHAYDYPSRHARSTEGSMGRPYLDLPPATAGTRMRENLFESLADDPEAAQRAFLKTPTLRQGVFPPGTEFRSEHGMLLGTTPGGDIISGGRLPQPRAAPRPYSNEMPAADARRVVKQIKSKGGNALILSGTMPGYARVHTLVSPGRGRLPASAGSKLRDATAAAKVISGMSQGKIAVNQAQWDAAAEITGDPPWASVSDPRTGQFDRRRYAQALAMTDILGGEGAPEDLEQDDLQSTGTFDE